MSRKIWISLALDHDYDCAPSLLPHEYIQSLTTERLRDLVIRSTRGYTYELDFCERTQDNTQHQNENTRAAHGQFQLAGFGFLHSCVKIANEIVVTWSAGIFTVGNWRDGYIAMIEEAVSH